VTRERRLFLLAGAVALATVIVVGAIAISQGGADDEEEPAPRSGDAAPRGLFEGIAQDRVWLGDPGASVTLIEFADLQCPFCAEFALEELPDVIDRHVRPGRVRLELRVLAFLGPDSVRGQQAAHAAALQDRLWNYTELFFRNQGTENSGYVTDSFLQRLARQTAGLDEDQFSEDFGSREAEALSDDAGGLARRLQVGGTPAFYLVRDGGRPEPVEIENLDEALAGQ
jgi:protein-disulfide isomerase